jgi:hypothetical protein
MTDKEFNAEEFLSYKMSPDEVAGKTPLPPEGNYPNCHIEELKVFPPSEKYPKEGVVCVFYIKFVPETSDITLEKRVNFKVPVSRRSAYWKLMNAVFGEEGMKDHEAKDLEGRKVNIYISHEHMDGPNPIKYADFKYSPIKG